VHDSNIYLAADASFKPFLQFARGTSDSFQILQTDTLTLSTALQFQTKIVSDHMILLSTGVVCTGRPSNNSDLSLIEGDL
jgi:hypothetical protein